LRPGTFFTSARFQNLKQGYPVDSGRFHGDGCNPAVLEPVGGCQQVFGEGGKPAHRMWVSVNGHGDVNFGCADVDACCVGVNGMGRGDSAEPEIFGFSWHERRSCAMPSGPNRAEKALS
jgi:hypothetical protein